MSPYRVECKRSMHVSHNSSICGPERSGEATISVRTKNSSYRGTRSRMKVSVSRTIMTDIPCVVKGRGSSREALSGTMEARCVTLNGAGGLESI